MSYAVKFQLRDLILTVLITIWMAPGIILKNILKNLKLPAAVKESFSKSRYADWKVNSYNAIENNKGKNHTKYRLKKELKKRPSILIKTEKKLKGKKPNKLYIDFLDVIN